MMGSKQADEVTQKTDGAGTDLTKTPRVALTWAERSVWTPQMLAALQRGVKGGKRAIGDHHRWPNAYFEKFGLFSLTTAHAQACQSVKR